MKIGKQLSICVASCGNHERWEEGGKYIEGRERESSRPSSLNVNMKQNGHIKRAAHIRIYGCLLYAPQKERRGGRKQRKGSRPCNGFSDWAKAKPHFS